MLNVTIIEISGISAAMTGMRYPKNSEGECDSSFFKGIGPKDKELLLKLTRAGRDHRKALRMLHVQASINMPISWWIQYDTYKIGTVANSRSRMHKMGSRLLTKDDFYCEPWNDYMENVLAWLNSEITFFQKTEDQILKQQAWRRIIDLLPMSYCQERMIDLNYEVLLAILHSRYNEKLRSEWRFFCNEFLNTCPCLRELYEVSK